MHPHDVGIRVHVEEVVDLSRVRWCLQEPGDAVEVAECECAATCARQGTVYGPYSRWPGSKGRSARAA